MSAPCHDPLDGPRGTDIYIHLYKHKCQSVKVVRIRGWKKKQYIKDKGFSKPKSQRMYVGLKKFP
jgi:hypothetical protein